MSFSIQLIPNQKILPLSYLSPEKIKQKAKESKNYGTDAEPNYCELVSMVDKADRQEIVSIMAGVLEDNSPEKIVTVINFLIGSLEQREWKPYLEKARIAFALIPEEKNPFLADNQKDFTIKPNLKKVVEWNSGLALSQAVLAKMEGLIHSEMNERSKVYLDFVYGTDRDDYPQEFFKP